METLISRQRKYWIKQFVCLDSGKNDKNEVDSNSSKKLKSDNSDKNNVRWSYIDWVTFF